MEKSKLTTIYDAKQDQVDKILLALSIPQDVVDLSRQQFLDFDFVMDQIRVHRKSIQDAVQILKSNAAANQTVLSQIPEAQQQQLKAELEEISGERTRTLVANEIENLENALRLLAASAYQQAQIQHLTSGKSLRSMLRPLGQTVTVEVMEDTKFLPEKS